MSVSGRPLTPSNPTSASGGVGFHLPIVEHLKVGLDDAERARINALAVDLTRRDPRLSSTNAFGPRVAPGLGPWPSLVFEDHSGISLYKPEDDRRYAHRALLLAGDGDVVALPVERNRSFEAYCRNTLGLGDVEICTPDAVGPPTPLSVRCARDERFLERVARLAEDHGGLNLLPYLGDGKAWALARAIAERTDADIRVIAAPPRLTRCVNDKLWFEARVEQVLGRGALPEVRLASGPALLAFHVRALAGRYASVAIKVPASASSVGNIVMDSSRISGRSLAGLRDDLYRSLAEAGWRGDFPLLVTAWEQPILASPSVQVWVPHPFERLPVIEGIFEQRLVGRKRAFVGAVPSTLPQNALHQVATEGLQLAYLLQVLGYFGRCSFDCILLSDHGFELRVHWVECNARWGGVSVPMTLVNRLMGDWSRHPFAITQINHLSGKARPLTNVIKILADRLFIAGKRETGVIIMTPGPLEAGTGADLVVMADSIAAAEDLTHEVAARLSKAAG